MDIKVGIFLEKATKWRQELEHLRTIILDCGLTEEWKWRVPCYTLQDSNIVLINSFKDYCAVGFFKGVLLKDSEGILYQQTENSQSARLIRFSNLQEITESESVLKSYIREAMEIEKAGLKVAFKKNTELVFLEELQTKLDEIPDFKTAFYALTPGRQRAYDLYFSAPKQSQTRYSRIEKYTQQILEGKGINDCTCGLSKKFPYCDGSHKELKLIK